MHWYAKNKLVNRDDLARQFQLEPDRCVRNLTEAMESGVLKPDNFSIQDLFVSLIENGKELLDSISYRKSGRRSLMEAAGAVDTSAFANITGQLVFNKIKEGYDFPEFLWPQLCTTQQTNFLNGERIPGIGEIGDKAELVGEGENFPEVGLSEEYIDTAPTQKRGFIVPVTREIVVADRTGLLLDRCNRGGFWLGVNKEKRVIDTATGQTNNYKRNGTALNTYLTSGAYINSQSNTMADWASIEKAELLFDGITDPNTGEPIILPAAQLLVPSALKRTANLILMSSEVARVDNQANASTYRTFADNPVKSAFYGGPVYGVLSNAFVKARTSSASTWFFGDFKRALIYMECWGIEPTQAMDNSEAQFARDVWMRFKVSERGVAQVYEPRYVTKNT